MRPLAAFALVLGLVSCSGAGVSGTALEKAAWEAAPGLASGMMTALQAGDPAAGPYQVLIKFPAGAVVAPHYHKSDEFATVLSGAVIFGQGEAIDDAKGVEIGAGGYITVPAGVAHWAKCKSEAVIVRYGSGPRELTACSPEKPAPTKGTGARAVAAKDVPWEPSDLAKGAGTCVPYGDAKTGPHMFRVKFPAGIVRPPHWHSFDECVTVLSGRLMIGEGEKVDESKGLSLGSGGTYLVPRKVPHWLVTKEDASFIVYVNGARDVVYVDPADDPAKKK